MNFARAIGIVSKLVRLTLTVTLRGGSLQPMTPLCAHTIYFEYYRQRKNYI